MDSPPDSPDLQSALAAAQAEITRLSSDLGRVEQERDKAVAQRDDHRTEIDRLTLEIKLLRHRLFSSGSERDRRHLDQLELKLEEAEAAAAEAAAADAERQAEQETAEGAGKPASRPKRGRKPFPTHLPRERRVMPSQETCERCGGDDLRKVGEDVTETLEVIPRRWVVIQTVREAFSCRCCEKMAQAPAPFHPILRGFAGPSLLAMICFEKYGQHQPLNRQSERYRREGIDLSVSTLADLVGTAAHVLKPLAKRIEDHVLAAARLHGDDTTMPVLATGKADTGRLWVYVRDDAPFAGEERGWAQGIGPPAAFFRYSRTRAGANPQAHLADYTGLLQADAFAGYTALADPDRPAGAIEIAFCWSHARRKFFELADATGATRRGKGRRLDPPPISPIALEAVERIDAFFAIEREINGKSAEERRAIRQERSKPLVDDLFDWLTERRARISSRHALARACDYLLRRRDGFTAFLDDGWICLSNNAAERALRGVALGRKAWLFAGSDRGGDRAAMMNTLIVTAKLNGVDPQAWLADVFARIADIKQGDLDQLLPWNWSPPAQQYQA